MPESEDRPSPLDRREWQYVEHGDMESMSGAEWAVLERQRPPYYAAHQASAALELLRSAADAPSYGYRINHYRHCLQSATMLMRAGHDEETIVCGLFHDVGYVTCPDTHGQFAAALLAPYVGERNRWTLHHHGVFINHHAVSHPGIDRDARERFRGHPHFEWAAEFVARFDQNAMSSSYDTAPLDVFEPMVHRLFAAGPGAEWREERRR